MLKKILSDKRYIKSFFSGFHYGVKHFETIEDRHFFIYTDHDKDHAVASFQHEVYRNAIKISRNYMLYRYEILTIGLLFFTTFLFLFTW